MLNISFYSEYTKKNQEVTLFVPKQIDKILFVLHPKGSNNRLFSKYLDFNKIATTYNLLIVIPNGDNSFFTWLENGQDYYQYFLKEVRKVIKPFINKNKLPEYIAGVSMGAYGTIQFATFNKGMFDGVILISGSYDIVKRDREKRTDEKLKNEWKLLFGNKLDLKHDIFKYKPDNKSIYFLASGTEDYLHNASIKLAKWLKNNHCNVKIKFTNGRHEKDFFVQYLQTGIQYIFERKL